MRLEEVKRFVFVLGPVKVDEFDSPGGRSDRARPRIHPEDRDRGCRDNRELYSEKRGLSCWFLVRVTKCVFGRRGFT